MQRPEQCTHTQNQYCFCIQHPFRHWTFCTVQIPVRMVNAASPITVTALFATCTWITADYGRLLGNGKFRVAQFCGTEVTVWIPKCVQERVINRPGNIGPAAKYYSTDVHYTNVCYNNIFVGVRETFMFANWIKRKKC